MTLPSSGFIVLDSSGPGEEGVLEESAIAVSQRLPAGTHRNVTISVNRSPPGGVVNQTTLNNTGTYEALLYHDSNNNSRFEFITSGRSTDRPFIVGTGSNAHLASDGARIIVEGSRGDPNATPTPTASIQFTDQHTTGSTVTIRSVTLPQGGFIAVHNQSYLYGGDPTQTAIGISRYLPAGTHQNVSVTLVNGSIQQSQTLVAIPSQDTDNNQTYDYVRSDGFRDVPYTDNNGAVTDRAAVTVASSTTPTVDLSSPITPATTTDTPQPAAGTDTVRSSTGDAGGSEKSATQWLTGNWIIILVAIIVIVVVGSYLLVRQA
uniref:DUF7282 domain-containing protein n=1 Tax=Halococcus thailandensis TaxID=335952 RepID=UPI001268948E|nr:hypothetical protein [Halococcus thailandensis]